MYILKELTNKMGKRGSKDMSSEKELKQALVIKLESSLVDICVSISDTISELSGNDEDKAVYYLTKVNDIANNAEDVEKCKKIFQDILK